MSVPFFEYKGDRNELKDWAIDMESKDKLEEYKQKRFTPPDLNNLDK